MTVLLDVQGLTKTYGAGSGLFGSRRLATVVDDVSFQIPKGATFGLVGESGSGKSTIGRMVLRLIEADAGRVVFDGIDLAQQARGDMMRLRRRMQIIFQDPFSSLDPRVRVGAALAEAIGLHNLRPAHQINDRVAEVMHLVGLAPAHRDRFPHEFSGGQRQRVAIARALAVEPEVIVCDEPVSALDVSIQAQVLNLLANLRDRLGMSLLFISHDMAVVRHIATHVGVLYAGKLVESGPVAQIFGQPRHPYTRMLMEATPSAVPGLRRSRSVIAGEPPSPFASPAGCAFASRCPMVTDHCQSHRPQATTYAVGGHQAACWRAAEASDFTPPGDDEGRMSDAYRRRMALLRRARLEGAR